MEQNSLPKWMATKKNNLEHCDRRKKEGNQTQQVTSVKEPPELRVRREAMARRFVSVRGKRLNPTKGLGDFLSLQISACQETRDISHTSTSDVTLLLFLKWSWDPNRLVLRQPRRGS